MMKRTVITVFFAVFLCQTVFSQFTVSLEMKKCPYATAYFCKVQAQKVMVMQTRKTENGKVSFSFPQRPEAGIYRIHYKDTAFVDIVVDRENQIELRTQFPNLVDSLQVLKSRDNEDYYSYLKFKNRKLALLSYLGTKISGAYAGKKAKLEAQNRVEFIKGCITRDVEEYARKLWAKDTTTFVSKLLRAMIIPNMDMYMLQHPEGKVYQNDVEFLMEHFFDNIPFNDSAFINSEIYYRTLRYYFEKLVQPRTNEGFQFANENILSRAKSSVPVRRELIRIMCSLYEDTQLENVYVNLFDTYISKDPSLLEPNMYAKTYDRVRIIKLLQPGIRIQNIAGNDTTGKAISLEEVKGKWVLLLFWTPGKKSQDAMLRLKDLDSLYKPEGFRIFGVCTDSTDVKGKQVLRKIRPGWINVFNGSEETSKMFNTWSLPSMYLLNEEKRIVYRPMNTDYLQNKMKEITGR